MKMRKRFSVALAAGYSLAFLLFAGVVIRFPDHFFVDDTYFYLQVARNIARGWGSTFNGLMPTNGYHPLWMLALVGVFKLIPEKALAVHAVGVLLALVDAAALLILSRLIRKTAGGVYWPACLLYLPFCFCTQLGTEGALSGCLLAGLMLVTYQLCSGPSYSLGLFFSLIGALAVLARLDSIFIVGSVIAGAAAYSYYVRSVELRRALLSGAPVYVVLWGAYLWSNLHWFGTLQPISGLLKIHPYGEIWRWSRITPIALVALVVIAFTFPLVARFKRDICFYVVEMPFTVGVLFHAAYIYLAMSHETHWSWYYTSWILLSALLLSRASTLVFEGMRPQVQQTLGLFSVLVLLLIWYRSSYVRRGHREPTDFGVDLRDYRIDGLPMRRVLAYDLAGRLAFYSDLQIVSLDGLMGDLQYQRDLSQKGIAGVIAKHRLQALVGPYLPLADSDKVRFCDYVFLSSMRFHCIAIPKGGWTVDRVEVFARLSKTSAGVLELKPEDLLSDGHGYGADGLSVWRLHPAMLPPSDRTAQAAK